MSKQISTDGYSSCFFFVVVVTNNGAANDMYNLLLFEYILDKLFNMGLRVCVILTVPQQRGGYCFSLGPAVSENM
jgi:hypothetical protein